MTDKKSNVQISMPPQDEQVAIHLRPGDAFKLNGAQMDDLTFDILGSDLIIADLANNSKIIFPGLAVLLFDEKGAPEFNIGGVSVSPDMFLSQIGTVRNVTEQDFLTFTSLEVNNSQESDANKTGAEEASNEQAVETVQLQLQAALNTIEAQKNTQTPEDNGVGNDEVQTIVQGKSKLKQSGRGLPLAPPVKKSSSEQSSSLTKKEDETSASTTEEPTTVRTSFDFTTRVLQLQSFDDTVNNTFEGGGGSTLSAFNPSNSLQFSSDAIDVVSDASVTTVYADDPDHFDEDTTARVIQISPNLPAGFEVTEIVISLAAGAWPAGFSIEGIVEDTGDNNLLVAASESAGTFTISDVSGLTLSALDNLDLLLTYDVGVTAPVFEMDIELTSTFDVGSGLTVPDETVQDFTVNQKFMVKDVTSSADLVETDAGDTVVVLSTTPNANVINTSDSDVEVYGARGKDTITTGAGDDVIYGTLGDDIIDGGGNGADTGTNALGDVGDTLDFSAKNETISVDMSTGATYTIDIDSGAFTQTVTGIENISGSSENDTITGDANNNILRGNGGADVLSGGAGDDILDGGPGSSGGVGDTVSYAYITATSGLVVDLDGGGSATVNAPGPGDLDTLIDIENIIGTDFNDVFSGSDEDNRFEGGSGSDTVSYLEVGVSGVVVDLGANGLGDGVATDDGGGSGGQDVLIGIESVIGSDGDDTITGDGGNNIIQGALGSDALDGAGGTGDVLSFVELSGGFVTLDLVASTAVFSGDASTDNFSNFEQYVLTSQDDVVFNSAGDDVIDASFGTGDTINYSLSSGVYVNLTTDSADAYGGGAGIAVGTDLIQNFEHVIGSDHDDVLAGNSADNNLQGGNGNDTLLGIAGNDTLDGGAGINTASYASASAGVTASLDGGSATVDGDGGVDTFINIQNLIGSNFVDDLTGDANANTIDGGDGEDFLYGLAGDDHLIGGVGNDDLYGGAGDDIIDGSIGYYDVAYYSSAGIAITVDLADPAADIQVSDDGQGGADTLINIEAISASIYDDHFIMDDVAIQIFGGNGSLDFADYSGMTGQDLTVRLDDTAFQIFDMSGSTQRFHSVERLVTADGNDTVYSSNDNEENISTGAGNDYVYGSSLDDTIDLGSGNNTIDYSDVGVAVNSVVLDANGDGTIDRSGHTDTVFGVQNIIASQGDSTIVGSSAANTIYGHIGDDQLSGGLGDDFIYGGSAGVDQVYYASRADVTGGISFDMTVANGAADAFGNIGYYAVTLNGAGETDYLKSIGRIFGTNFNDTMTGGADGDRLYGEDGDDTLNGGGGSDYLVGGDGVDDINGGDGNDTLIGGAGIDSFDGGSGTDDINYSSAASGVNVNLGTNTVSDDGDGASDTIVAGTIEDVIGSNANDIIVGDSAVNDLDGGAGNDTLAGAAGDDNIDGGTEIDTIDYSLEAGGGGITIDLNSSSSNATDTYGDTDSVANVENVTGTAQIDNITGSSGDNTLRGGGGNDQFYASGGDDTIQGQSGTGDVMNYTSAVSGGLISSATSGTVIKSTGGTDSLTGIEFFSLSGADDTISITNSAASALGAESVLGNGGSDTIELSEFGGADTLTDLDVDGDTLANIFSDIEEIDLSSVTVTGGDDFDLTEVDVLGIAGAGGTLTLNVASGFSLNLDDTGDGSGNLFAGTSGTFNLTNGTTVEVQVV